MKNERKEMKMTNDQRINEIRARCEAAKIKSEALQAEKMEHEYACDVGYLFDRLAERDKEIERLKAQLDGAICLINEIDDWADVAEPGKGIKKAISEWCGKAEGDNG